LTEPSPAYLVADLEVHDAEAAVRYHREVQPLMERYGGRILATSLRNARVVEGEASSSVLALHRCRARRPSTSSSPRTTTSRSSCCGARVLADGSPTSVSDDGPWRTTALTARIGAHEAQGVLRERLESGRTAEASLFLRPYAALREGIPQMRVHLAERPLPSGDAATRRPGG
jgi:uncharacterized protein (DUF1330 family)